MKYRGVKDVKKMTKLHSFQNFINFNFYIFIKTWCQKICPHCPHCPQINQSTEIFGVSWVLCYQWTAPCFAPWGVKLTQSKEIFGVWCTLPPLPPGLPPTAPWTAPDCPLGQTLPSAWKSSVSVDYGLDIFLWILVKRNIVKIYECPEYEFLRGLWESALKKCNFSGFTMRMPWGHILSDVRFFRCW